MIGRFSEVLLELSLIPIQFMLRFLQVPVQSLAPAPGGSEAWINVVPSLAPRLFRRESILTFLWANQFNVAKTVASWWSLNSREANAAWDPSPSLCFKSSKSRTASVLCAVANVRKLKWQRGRANSTKDGNQIEVRRCRFYRGWNPWLWPPSPWFRFAFRNPRESHGGCAFVDKKQLHY